MTQRTYISENCQIELQQDVKAPGLWHIVRYLGNEKSSHLTITYQELHALHRQLSQAIEDVPGEAEITKLITK